MLLTDPFETGNGLTPPRLKSDLIVKTLSQYPIPYPPHEGTFVVHGEGEYEVKGIEVNGWQVVKESAKDTLKTVYVIKMEDMRIGLLGHIADIPDADILERIGDVDILVIPGGGDPYLPQEKAAKLARQMSAKIVIPSLFKVSGLKRKADDVKDFLDELEEKTEPQEKLVVKKKELVDKLSVFVPRL